MDSDPVHRIEVLKALNGEPLYTGRPRVVTITDVLSVGHQAWKISGNISRQLGLSLYVVRCTIDSMTCHQGPVLYFKWGSLLGLYGRGNISTPTVLVGLETRGNAWQHLGLGLAVARMIIHSMIHNPGTGFDFQMGSPMRTSTQMGILAGVFRVVEIFQPQRSYHVAGFSSGRRRV